MAWRQRRRSYRYHRLLQVVEPQTLLESITECAALDGSGHILTVKATGFGATAVRRVPHNIVSPTKEESAALRGSIRHETRHVFDAALVLTQASPTLGLCW